MTLTPVEIAVAFSTHRFTEAEPYLAEGVFWDLVGGKPLLTKAEVLELGASSTEVLESNKSTTFLEQRVIDGGDTVVVDSVIEYVSEQSETSVVSSCDLYEFENGLVTHIRSYAGERSF